MVGQGRQGGFCSPIPPRHPFGRVSRDVTFSLPFCQQPPPARLSQCLPGSTRCPCRVQGFAAFPGTAAPLPPVPEPHNPLIPLGQGIPAGQASAKFQIWFLDVPVTVLLRRADVGSSPLWACSSLAPGEAVYGPTGLGPAHGHGFGGTGLAAGCGGTQCRDAGMPSSPVPA